ncbi:MAG: hypothetical protein OEW08_11750 [Gammaproteobacteria bacterium]|nr:hypothetical protein [Gammaproteobacteria bacterium]
MNFCKTGACAIALIVCLPCAAPMAAEMVVSVDQYNREVATPARQQWNILDVVVTLNFPESIATVGDAVEYALRQSGYNVAPNALLDRNTTVLFSLPLPGIHRQISNSTLLNFLKMVAGPAYTLVIDQRTRTITYEASSAFPVVVAVTTALAAERRNAATTLDITTQKVTTTTPAIQTPGLVPLELTATAPAGAVKEPTPVSDLKAQEAAGAERTTDPQPQPLMIVDPLANID